MKKLRALIIGLIVGGALGFGAGYNYGRGAPIVSNPFKERTLATQAQEKANEIVDGVKKKIHDATE